MILELREKFSIDVLNEDFVITLDSLTSLCIRMAYPVNIPKIYMVARWSGKLYIISAVRNNCWILKLKLFSFIRSNGLRILGLTMHRNRHSLIIDGQLSHRIWLQCWILPIRLTQLNHILAISIKWGLKWEIRWTIAYQCPNDEYALNTIIKYEINSDSRRDEWLTYHFTESKIIVNEKEISPPIFLANGSMFIHN